MKMIKKKEEIRNYKKILARGSLLALILMIFGYAYFRTEDLIRGVKLSINGLENYASYRDPLLSVAGFAKHATTLSLNGREIPVTKDWQFEESLLLSPGWNIIEVKAGDKFGREKIINYNVIKI